MPEWSERMTLNWPGCYFGYQEPMNLLIYRSVLNAFWHMLVTRTDTWRTSASRRTHGNHVGKVCLKHSFEGVAQGLETLPIAFSSLQSLLSPSATSAMESNYTRSVALSSYMSALFCHTLGNQTQAADIPPRPKPYAWMTMEFIGEVQNIIDQLVQAYLFPGEYDVCRRSKLNCFQWISNTMSIIMQMNLDLWERRKRNR